MAVKKFLDYPGLSYYTEKLKNTFVKKGDLTVSLAEYLTEEEADKEYAKKSLVEALMGEAGKAATSEPQSTAVATIKDSGEYPEVGLTDCSTLGSFAVNGLLITGTAKQVTVPKFNDEGGSVTGYFVGLHLENAKQVKTANKPNGVNIDATGDLLLLLGSEDVTLTYIDVVDTADKTDRYTVAIVKEGVAPGFATKAELEQHKTEADEKYATKDEVDLESLKQVEQQFKELLGGSSTLEEALDGMFVPKDQAATKDDLSDMETKTDAAATYAKQTDFDTYKTEADGKFATKEDISSVYTPKGQKTAEELTADLLVADNVGDVYNVTTAITTDENYLEGAGSSYPAGTNVVIVEQDGSYKFDVLAGFVDLSGYVLDSDLVAITNEEIDAMFSE